MTYTVVNQHACCNRTCPKDVHTSASWHSGIGGQQARVAFLVAPPGTEQSLCCQPVPHSYQLLLVVHFLPNILFHALLGAAENLSHEVWKAIASDVMVCHRRESFEVSRERMQRGGKEVFAT
jgi:hypothetical protein